MFSKSFFRAATKFYSWNIGRSIIGYGLGSWPGQRIAIAVFAGQDPLVRRTLVRKLMETVGPEPKRRFVNLARKLARAGNRQEVADIYWLALADSATVDEAWQQFFNPSTAPQANSIRRTTNQPYARALAAYELARYKDAVTHFLHLEGRDSDSLRLNHDYLKAAFSASKIADKDLAARFFARQYVNAGTPLLDPGDLLKSLMLRIVSYATIATLSKYLAPTASDKKDLKVGIFFLSSTQALGHAILDPYYFLALHRDKYDRIFFIGPQRESYRPASRICLEIVEQYGAYIETESDPLLNLSWMSLGIFPLGPLKLTIREHRGQDPETNVSWVGARRSMTVELELVVEHYWSLLREAVHRTRDTQDAFHHNAWHMSVPEMHVRIGEEFSACAGIGLEKPIVVLHARDHRYHEIGKQSFRDARIENYLPAIEHLLAAGYRVVRIGDEAMSKLSIASDAYFELPFMDGYDNRLDPFFISRAHFMIGGQSGPCSYARVFGVPLLSVNAVLHYTLLSSGMEMACFKRYFRVDDDRQPVVELTLEEALAAGVAHFDNSHQYKIKGIDVADASGEEILASVKDMIAWLKDPDLRETDQQESFRKTVEAQMVRLKREGPALDLPIGDFLGIVLPGYRISPSVAEMRAEKADTPA